MDRDKLRAHIKRLVIAGAIEGEIIDRCGGDRYNSENGEDIQFAIGNKKYSIGYVYITEDGDDWAQADCYEQSWCLCEDKYINPKDLYEIVESRKSIERDARLSGLEIID
jgi:hypothetical protein